MTACQRAGCTGRHAPDGYCDECGHRASPTAPSALRTASGHAASAAVVSGARPVSGATGGLAGGTARGSTRGRLGANLVAVPAVPRRDPAKAVMADPQVPESQRFCGVCGEPVGRGRDGEPGRAEGFCPRDRTPFHFTPKLRPGEVVGKRYEVLGCLAHGGLGWIYLGRDRNISEAGSDRWVVLKGLINTGDADAAAAAVAERRFLVEVDHPNIVKIHDFAQHADKTGEAAGYIVMEYIGGRSLKDIALGHRGPRGERAPLPLPQVLAYGIEILPALGYLHERGLLFCDFKPDNVIHTEDQLKLIDLGAVRRIDDDASALYGTVGYQAPELAAEGPSIGSDLYTVGRTLAVLSFDFAGFTSRYADRLPDTDDVPLLRAEESYRRLLHRATHSDPALRFTSAGEMADQLTGVLRETLSAADGLARPSVSASFTAEHTTFGSDVNAPDGADVMACLPLPLIDLTDPGAGLVATLSGTEPLAVLAALSRVDPRTVEMRLKLVRAHLDTGDPGAAQAELDLARAAAGADWRIGWHAGLIALARGDHGGAGKAFDTVYDLLPGELAVQLAVAVCAELSGAPATAASRYERVWRTDRSFTSAAFGLARTRAATGDRVGAVDVLDEVPTSSSQHTAAQVAALRARLSTAIGALTEADLLDASARLARLGLDVARQARLSIEMFSAALAWLDSGHRAGMRAPSPARALHEHEVREGLERSYRLLATLESDDLARYELVDHANAVRPRTVI